MVLAYCTGCGVARPAEAVFCSSCGAPSTLAQTPNGRPNPPSPTAPSGIQGTNSYAIAAIILPFIPMCGIGSVLGIIFGKRALREIAETHQEGEGLAKAGIIIGWVTLAITVLSVPLSIALRHTLWFGYGLF